MLLSDNKLIGLCPPGTQRGHEVCILCRGKGPVVLRPATEPGQYLMPSEAYIHGGIFSELLAKGIAGSLQTVNIV